MAESRFVHILHMVENVSVSLLTTEKFKKE